ncbi:MAG: copper amine oxidase family protein [Clostridia bacterium]|nr:copper amine oxidase family protein [Clostridia bacterium]
MKKAALTLLCLIILLQSLNLPMITADTVTQKVIYDEFVDVSITIDTRDFYVYSLKKQFGEITYAEGTVIFSQIDKILPWLGYTAKYDTTTKILTAFNDKQRFVIKAGNLTYTLNGEIVKFTKPSKDIKGKLMVPTEELFKALGYTIQSDAATKTIHITKFKDYNTGRIALYNKSATSNNFYYLDTTALLSQNYKDITINELYSYGSNIIGYVYDKVNRYNKLVKYENGSFVDINFNNFDIVSTYEFGNSRVFYGYDNTNKKYKLISYNGYTFNIVVDDCYSSQQINFKGSIILNKYDSDRNYSIVKVDQYFNVKEIDKKKTMTEYFISDNWLYMKTKPQEGTDISFLVYNGTDMLKVNIPYNILPRQITNLEFDDIRICNGRIFLLLLNTSNMKSLYELKEDDLVPIFEKFTYHNFNLMESYKGKLYLCGYERAGKFNRYDTLTYTPGGKFILVNDPKFTDKNIMFTMSKVENGILFLGGKMGSIEYRPSYVINTPSQEVLYVHNGYAWNYAMDIRKLDAITNVGTGMFLKVTDFDRGSGSASRNSILYLENPAVNSYLNLFNVAIDYTTTHEAVIDRYYIFAGSNKLTKKTGLNYSQYGVANELIRGFTVNYWNKVRGQIFCGGKVDMQTYLYNISQNKEKIIRIDFDTKLVLETKDPNLYLIYGIERDKTNIYNGNKALYLYNASSNTFTLVTVGIEIEKSLLLDK